MRALIYRLFCASPRRAHFAPHCADGRPACTAYTARPGPNGAERCRPAGPHQPADPYRTALAPPSSTCAQLAPSPRCGGRIPARARRHPRLGSPRHDTHPSARPAPAASCPVLRRFTSAAHAPKPMHHGHQAHHPHGGKATTVLHRFVPALCRPGAVGLRQRVARWPARRCGPAHRRPHRWRASCLASSRRCGQSAGADSIQRWLAEPLTQDAAVRIALLNNPGLQARLAALAWPMLSACKPSPCPTRISPGALCQQPRTRDRAHAGVQPARPHHPCPGAPNARPSACRLPPCRPRKTW